MYGSNIAGLHDLLSFDGEDFIKYVYLTLLGRLPESEGLIHYVQRLRNGVEKETIIGEVASSEEAARKGISMPGLADLVADYKYGKTWIGKIHNRNSSEGRRNRRSGYLIQGLVEESRVHRALLIDVTDRIADMQRLLDSFISNIEHRLGVANSVVQSDNIGTINRLDLASLEFRNHFKSLHLENKNIHDRVSLLVDLLKVGG